MGSKDIDWMFAPYHPQSAMYGTKSVAGKKSTSFPIIELINIKEPSADFPL